MLVNDRFQDLRRLACDKGTLDSHVPLQGVAVSLEGNRGQTTPGAAERHQNTFMREFFDDVAAAQRILKACRLSVKRFEDVEARIMQATTSDEDRKSSELLQSLVEETNGHISSSKVAIENIKTKCQNRLSVPGPAEQRIQENMLRALMQKQQQLLIDFQQAQIDCKRTLERREFREMQLLCPEANAQEVQEMLQAGETSGQMVARKMAGTHAMLFEELQRIRDKHEDILKLERSVADLHQMFQEVALLVDSQGEMLDVIEENVHSANSYTAKANKALDTAVKVQRNTKKWECCLIIVLLVIAAVVFVPMVVSFSAEPRSAIPWILVAVFAVIIIIGAVCCFCKLRSGCGEGGCSGGVCSFWTSRRFKDMPELPV